MNSTEKAWEIAELKEENRRLETDNKNLREENLRMLKLVNEKITEAHEQTERAEIFAESSKEKYKACNSC